MSSSSSSSRSTSRSATPVPKSRKCPLCSSECWNQLISPIALKIYIGLTFLFGTIICSYFFDGEGHPFDKSIFEIAEKQSYSQKNVYIAFFISFLLTIGTIFANYLQKHE